MPTNQDFVDKAREYIGTPFHHGARVKGRQGGVDCAGLIICTMRDLGLPYEDCDHYPLSIDLPNFLTYTNLNCIPIPTPENIWELPIGSLIVFSNKRMRHHMAIYTGEGMILHAWHTAGFKTVAETQPLQEWVESIHSCWLVKGIQY